MDRNTQAPTDVAAKGFEMVGGRYAFRFNGFAKAGGEPYYLIGVGIMEMHLGVLKGHQRSSVVRIQDPTEGALAPGPGANGVTPADFELSGTYGVYAEGMWEAAITFTSGAPVQTLETKFAFVEVDGGKKLWLVSTESNLLPADGGPAAPVPEMVTGEAVRTN